GLEGELLVQPGVVATQQEPPESIAATRPRRELRPAPIWVSRQSAFRHLDQRGLTWPPSERVADGANGGVKQRVRQEDGPEHRGDDKRPPFQVAAFIEHDDGHGYRPAVPAQPKQGVHALASRTRFI